jgi:uncharacterized repeat protein (TIGR01451 family)
MLKRFAYSFAFFAVAGSVAAIAANQQRSPLSSDMKAFVVNVDSKGHEVLRAAKQAEPGQTIQYQLTYANHGKKSLKGLVVTGPIPSHTHYLANTAKTKVNSARLVSIDGGKTFEKEPVKRQQKMANGKVKTVVIPASKYTHIRWTANSPLNASGKQVYTYRVKVN